MKRRSIWELIVLALVVAVTLGILAGAYFVVAGVSARPEPSGLETFIARTVRNVAIVWHAGHPPNPVPNTGDRLVASVPEDKSMIMAETVKLGAASTPAKTVKK